MLRLALPAADVGEVVLGLHDVWELAKAVLSLSEVEVGELGETVLSVSEVGEAVMSLSEISMGEVVQTSLSEMGEAVPVPPSRLR